MPVRGEREWESFLWDSPCGKVSSVVCGLFFFQAEDGIRDLTVTGVQTCALPISGTRVVAAHAGVRIGGDIRSHRRPLGYDGRLTTHEAIDGGFARHHGGGAAW